MKKDIIRMFREKKKTLKTIGMVVMAMIVGYALILLALFGFLTGIYSISSEEYQYYRVSVYIELNYTEVMEVIYNTSFKEYVESLVRTLKIGYPNGTVVEKNVNYTVRLSEYGESVSF